MNNEPTSANNDSYITLTQKESHDMRNKLNSVLGYANILQDDDTLLDEYKAMAESISNAALHIESFLTPKKVSLKTKQPKEESDLSKELNLLIVDDNKDNRTILELILKKYPVKSFVASNGTQAVQIARNEKIDLVFMDLHLPDINGAEAAKEIKKLHPHIKAVAISGDINALNNGLENKIFEISLLKPFNRDQIKSIVTSFFDTPQKSSSSEISTEVSTQNANNPKVLIIDDNLENLALFQKILEPYHYDLKVASSGEAALKTIQEFKPELILLDVIMPNMSGYDVLKELKKSRSTSDIPVIFLTAKDTTEDIVKGFEAGAVDYIAKPFHQKELIARVDTHLQKAKLFANLKKLMEYSFHELYTPLSIISSAMQIQELEHGKTQHTQMTLAACKTLQNIYDDLYYSISYSNMNRDKTDIDFANLLRQRVEYFGLVAKSRYLSFKTQLPESLFIHINQQDIERVVDNLISNALKYTKQENEISLSLIKKDNSWIFSICNPIYKDVDVEKIFHKYYRNNEEVFGVGLGLELVESICHENAITLTASTDNGHFCINMELIGTR